MLSILYSLSQMVTWDKQSIIFKLVSLPVKVIYKLKSGEIIDEDMVLHICDAPSAD